MKIMAIDYGDTRTGVAFSDLTGTIAGETLVLVEREPGRLAGKLAELYASRGAQLAALGLPLNMDGSHGARAELSEAMAEALRARGLEVRMIDERLTTVAAHSIMAAGGISGKKRKSRIDAVAATLILETALGMLKNEKTEVTPNAD
ncbi:MAG: Holliday junction resolvase RuvX [Oscillospiraceae bacterium]|nr:Holliday junction resolvase RuvX [Oscillospiraceae bacterium]